MKAVLGCVVPRERVRQIDARGDPDVGWTSAKVVAGVRDPSASTAHEAVIPSARLVARQVTRRSARVASPEWLAGDGPRRTCHWYCQ